MRFREYVAEMWYRHKEEKDAWERTLPSYSLRDWFTRSRWFLKKKYIEERREGEGEGNAKNRY